VAAYGVAAVVVLGMLVRSGLAPSQRAAVADAVAGQAAALVVVGVLAVAGFVALVTWVVGRYAGTARRLAADTRLLLHANPDHRLERSGPPELVELAAAVEELAEQRRVAEREVAVQVSAARSDLEEERNRLATLMAELAVAVLVCNVEGRILLYNAAARSVLADDAAVGLGRSVFGVVDRGLLAYAVDRIAAGSTDAHVATTVRGNQVLQVRVGAVRGPDGAVSGFVLILEDLTDRMLTSDRRDALLRQLTEGTRASLGSIQAAIETVVDYPDMEPDERSQFLGIVRDETRGLGGQVERWVAESAGYLGADWLLTEISGADLLAVVTRALQREGTVEVQGGATAEGEPEPLQGGVWVRADSHALAQAAVHLAGRLHAELGVDAVVVVLELPGHHAQLGVRWHRPAPAAPEPEAFQAWLDQPLTGGAAASVRDVVERHGGEIWCAGGPDDSAQVSILLPLTEAGRATAVSQSVSQSVSPSVSSSVSSPPRKGTGPGAGTPRIASRPEFYDFQLFDRVEESAAWQDRLLGEIAYTVFDTETTGLEATGGDEIISVGAVRVVNGRLLRQETFERLVDPQRRVPAASTAVHGITGDMLVGQPTIDTVLPDFARYAQDTVLVGHNVGFDMQFLRLKESRTGVRLTQPVLDTLLLDSAVHPDHEEHSLEAIAARLGVDVLGRHTALGDALVTGEVFVRLLNLLRQRGVTTVGEAAEASRATLHARLDRSMYGGSGSTGRD